MPRSFAFYGLRDDAILQVICPTSQNVFAGSRMPATARTSSNLSCPATRAVLSLPPPQAGEGEQSRMPRYELDPGNAETGYFAWGCFRYFGYEPCRPCGRPAGPELEAGRSPVCFRHRCSVCQGWQIVWQSSGMACRERTVACLVMAVRDHALQSSFLRLAAPAPRHMRARRGGHVPRLASRGADAYAAGAGRRSACHPGHSVV